MDRELKQRVVGAAVLVALAVVFIPIFLDDGAPPPPVPDAVSIPPEPSGFESRVVPLDEAREAAIEAGIDADLAPPAVPPQEPPAVPPAPMEESQPETTAAPALPPAAPAAPEPRPEARSPDAADTPRAEVVAWTVQLGSFANDENAKRLIEKLRAADYPAYLERRTDNGETAFKVRVGPEVRREDAESLRATLHKEFGLEGMLLRYQ